MSSSDEAGATQAKSPRAYLWAALAFLACPCHIPILIVVLSGTALGALLSEHFVMALLVLTVLFAVFAAAAVRAWKRGDEFAKPAGERPREEQHGGTG
ncbi:MAG: broad-spectrum mercury transporter MerE [Burkholderiales bacterium]